MVRVSKFMLLPHQQVTNKGKRKKTDFLHQFFLSFPVPSKPTHLTASTINCMNVSNDCHLLINWTYPYYPNAKINRFVIDVRIEELIGNNVNKVEDIYNSVPVTEDSISTFSYVVSYFLKDYILCVCFYHFLQLFRLCLIISANLLNTYYIIVCSNCLI